jgi:glycosyltransferase involved in cell wall biosynthesis
VLVDDGSTDDTADVVEGLLSRHRDWRSRFTYVRQENQGKSVALNTALKVAKGDWLAFLDSDDQWRRDKLEWQFRALRQFPDCGACFTDSVPSHTPDARETELAASRWRYPECFPPKEGPLGRAENPSLLMCRGWAGIYMQSVVVSEKAMRLCGEFDPSLRLGQDMDFLFRLGLVTSFCYVDLPLLEVHRDAARTVGLTTEYAPTTIPRLSAEASRMRKWLALIGGSRPELRAAIKHDLASVWSALANRHLAENESSRAREVLWNAVRNTFEWRLLAKWVMVGIAPSVMRIRAQRSLAR